MTTTLRPIVALGEILWDELPSGYRAGGAPFNFAFHCCQLGHPALIVSRVGNDERGHALCAEVIKLGMTDRYIQHDPTHLTGTVQVTVDSAGQPTYTITDNVAWDYLEWTETLETLSQRAGAICYGTLAQRNEHSRATIQRFLARAPQTSLRVCDINLRPTSLNPAVWRDAINACDWLKLNDSEREPLADAFGLAHDVPLAAIAPKAQLICLTRGAYGCLIQSAHETVDLPGHLLKVVDTVGAGDAFTAALLTQTLEGKPLEQAARFANIYAAFVAGHAGGTPLIDRRDVERLL